MELNTGPQLHIITVIIYITEYLIIRINTNPITVSLKKNLGPSAHGEKKSKLIELTFTNIAVGLNTNIHFSCHCLEYTYKN